MSQISNHAVRLLAGFMLNIALLIYVYFVVEGGPVAIHQGGDWMAILNEVPQTIVIFMVAVFMPYIMVWSRCKENSAVISLAGTVMLAPTVIACVVIASAQQALTKELTLDISWLILWGIAVYFVLIPQKSSSSE